MTESAQREFAQHDFEAALQDVLLPTGVPVLPRVDLWASFVNAPVGGDVEGHWFDVVPLTASRVALVVGDAVGTGMAATATMGQVRAVVSAGLAVHGDIPAALALADAFARISPDARGTSIGAAILDTDLLTLTYCTAGHPAPIVVDTEHGATLLELTGGGPLGSGLPFTCTEQRLSESAVVLLVTAEVGKHLAVDSAPQSLQSLTDALASGGPKADVERLASALATTVGSSGLPDSLTVVAAQVRRHPVADLFLDLAADLSAVTTFRTRFSDWDGFVIASEMDALALTHAGAELVTNAAEHAYASSGTPGTVQVHAALSAVGELTLEVADQGHWAEPSDDPGRGRGLGMAAGLVDSIVVRTGDSGSTVSVRHRLLRPVPLVESTHDLRPPEEPVDISHASSARSVVLSGAFGPDDVERVVVELMLASRGGTRDLDVDLREVTDLSSEAVRALAELADRYVEWHGTPHGLVLRVRSGSLTAAALDLARVPFVAA